MSCPSDLRALTQAANAAWPGIELQWLDSIDSTNSELMRRAAQARTTPVVLVACEQTAGRGRMGKSWRARPDAALMFSIGLPLAPQSWSGLSLVVGVAVVSALLEWARAQGSDATIHAQERLGLKWPNDVWLMAADGQGRKMAGILIETAAAVPGAPTAPLARYAVMGIGVNLLPQEVPGASVPPANATDWAGVTAEPAALLHVLLPAVLSAVKQFEAQGFASYQGAFAAWDVLQGRQVVLSDGRAGECLGVDAQGELLLSTDGAVVLVTSGEVSVRPQGAASGFTG